MKYYSHLHISFSYLKIIPHYSGFHFAGTKIVLYLHSLSGCSVARLSRLLWEQEAAGSNPATPTKKSFLPGRRDFLV